MAWIFCRTRSCGLSAVSREEVFSSIAAMLAGARFRISVDIDLSDERMVRTEFISVEYGFPTSGEKARLSERAFMKRSRYSVSDKSAASGLELFGAGV